MWLPKSEMDTSVIKVGRVTACTHFLGRFFLVNHPSIKYTAHSIQTNFHFFFLVVNIMSVTNSFSADCPAIGCRCNELTNCMEQSPF